VVPQCQTAIKSPPDTQCKHCSHIILANFRERKRNAEKTVDEIASQFGLEAVTLRACAKRVGVSPSSAFRHYTDKRALLTAFATRALHQLCDALVNANLQPTPVYASSANEQQIPKDAFADVGLAYVQFAIDKPAFFRAMWREETIYANDEHYLGAAQRLENCLKGGFADSLDDNNPLELDAQELLAWSAVHGLANLFVDGPVGKDQPRAAKLALAAKMISELSPLFQKDKTDTNTE